MDTLRSNPLGTTTIPVDSPESYSSGLPHSAMSTEASPKKLRAQFRRLARSLGAGRLLLRYKQMRLLGIWQFLEILEARRRVLPRILKAPPIFVGGGKVDVHMLLNHERLLEGL